MRFRSLDELRLWLKWRNWLWYMDEALRLRGEGR